MSNEDLQQIQTLVSGAKTILVLTHGNPSVDTMASALAIYLAFQKMGKMVTIAMESQPLVEVANLVGIDKVQTTLGGKNLMLTYKPYNEGDFQKILYPGSEGNEAAAGEFKLVIVPREGFVPTPGNFSFIPVGGSADLIITVEVLEPSQLGKLYDPNVFASAPIINLDNHDPNKDYGKFNLVEPDAASVSEITTFFLRAVNAQLDQDMAGNLYQGLISATSNFSTPKMGAATFEAAAICIRAGAKKSEPQTVSQNPVPPAQPVNPPLNNVPEDWTQPKIYRGGGGNV